MKNRFLAIMLVLCLVIFVMPNTVNAAVVDSGECGADGDSLTWSLDSNGTFTISGTGAMSDFNSYTTDENGNTVIFRYWNSCMQDIKSLVISEGVTYIGDRAFSGASNLQSITIADSVTEIGDQVFSDCDTLTTINFGSGLRETGIEMFLDCDSLTSFTFPETDTEYGRSFLKDCSNLKQVNFPENLKAISESMFESCSSLREIDIPDSVTEIGGSAFRYCEALTSINIPEGVTKLDVYTFGSCYSLTSVTLPESLTELSNSVFEYCNALTSITVPKNVTSMAHTFQDSRLEAITFTGNAPQMASDAFGRISPDVYYPADLETWTADVRRDYGGTPTWIAYCSGKHTSTSGTVIKEATCTEPGSMSCVCSICGEEYIKEIPTGGSHTNDNGTVTLEATCTETGEISYTCSACGEVTTETIPALGHDFTDVTPVFDAETHTHIYDCTRCDATTSEDCTFGEAEVTTEATPNNLGNREYTCTVCGGSYEETYVCRISGSSRYDTGYAVADGLKAQLGVDAFDNIIVASGLGYADALAASYLAAVKEAPILLVNERRMEEVADYIRENLDGDGMIYLIGGEGAVPAEMEEILDGFNVKRLFGKNRYETNMAILEEAGTEGQEILICTGRDFPDSLSASAVGKPILLVNKTLYDYQKEFLENSSGEFVIIGGTGAVSEDIEAELEEFGEITRLGGSGRYETCVMVAEYFFPEGAEAAIVAYSRNFPDGLCGGPLAYAMNAPLLLLQTDRGPEVIEYTNETGIKTGAVLGGASLIDDATINKVFVK